MYQQKVQPQFVTGGAAQSLTSAAVVARWVAHRNLVVKRLAFAIQTATVSNANIVITFKKRPIIGSASGESTIGTLSIPTTIAAGKTYYKDVSGTILKAGEEVVAEVTTQAGGGGAAGAGSAFLDCEDDPETAANQTNMVASV